MEEKFQLREIFNAELVQGLGDKIENAWPEFKNKQFVQEISSQLGDLSFGDRSSLIADSLKKFLPPDYQEAVKILIDALGPENQDESIEGYGGFDVMPQCLFVSRNGLDDYDTSIHALYEMTKRFTAEGDIRPFIKKYPKKTMEYLMNLTQDPSPFARRLASEGTRPRLPLTSRLADFQKDPQPVIDILEQLKEDPNLMVRRSVANNFNDISKDNPDAVVETLERWSQIKNPNTQWLISHSLRTILKQGHPGALKIMGYDPDSKVEVANFQISSETIQMGEDLSFQIEILSQEAKACKLMVDFVVYFMKANGKLAPKVFKGGNKTIKAGEVLHFQKKHSFKEMTTRKHYPGLHRIEVQINGKRVANKEFVLEV